MTPIEIGGFSIIFVGLTELIKEYGMPNKWAPLCAIVLSVGFSFLVAYRDGGGYLDAGISGLIIGLTAIGLYSTGQNITTAKTKKTEI